MDFKKSSNISFNPKDFEFINSLGNGSFGKVSLVKDKKGGLYAIKYFTNVKEPNFQKNFLREILIQLNTDYPSLVKFLGVNLQNDKDSTQFEPSVLMEYLPNGTLQDTLNEWGKNGAPYYWTPTCRYKALLGIAYGMAYLHKNRIVHRDLKPGNILLNQYFEVCICDFGISRYYDKSLMTSDDIEVTKNIGSPLYMAPEMFNDDNDYDKSADVYSFSLIAHQIITGQPFLKEAKNPYQVLLKIEDGVRPNLDIESISDKMKKLLVRCWSKFRDDRPSFEEICNSLSNDFSYSKEEIDESEIKEYISKLQAALKETHFQIDQNENKFDNELNYVKFFDKVLLKNGSVNEISNEINYIIFK
ncbi:hypothetical protein M9Y10_003544 [Tritrichomonas musculus]|uniref:Protein kinase domain-containing protein n=1 Tax=Tritrichomonas musculus TaxID=1915356 RepID=A0ABR2JPR8_9EUKA